jgi:hypothetical protein
VSRVILIENFWKLFQKRADELRKAESAENPAYDALLKQLQEIEADLYLEFSTNTGEGEFIVTADGDQSLFAAAREIVAAAPKVKGWTIVALKPKFGFPATVRWEKVSVKIEDIVFQPHERRGSPDLGLRILIKGIKPTEVEDAHNAVLRALDHGLGEEKHAQSVQHTEVHPLPANAKKEDFIPLSELPSYLEWRDKKLKSGE